MAIMISMKEAWYSLLPTRLQAVTPSIKVIKVIPFLSPGFSNGYPLAAKIKEYGFFSFQRSIAPFRTGKKNDEIFRQALITIS